MKKHTIGFILTAVWVLIAATIICSKSSQLSSIELNEWGDFLAGFVSPVALLWFVLGYFQQSEELHMNTEALLKQGEEIKKQREATEQLAAQTSRIAEKR